VSDYKSIHPDYGTLEDFKMLVKQAHSLNIRLITDLVINHTSDQHPWFQEARNNPASPFHDYYVWSDDPNKYSQARIIFTDTEKSNWAWDESAQKYFWHRFFSHQPDLNYDNPAVQQEMLDIMQFWLDLGIDGFRVDAIPYLFEREGTNCENLPETHIFLKKARALVDQNYPEAVLLSEANQWPEEVRPYLGDGDEMHMAFHFPLMPRIFMALRQQSKLPIQEILDRTPDIPENSQWATFLRNHDELTLEMVTEEERKWMWQEYAPEPRMKLNLGIRRRLTPLLDNNQELILLANSIMLTLPGSPVIYYGDEIGMGDNILLDDRDGVRTPMQWSSSNSADFSPANPQTFYSPIIDKAPYSPLEVNAAAQLANPNSLIHNIKHLIGVRNQHPLISLGDLTWLDSGIPNEVLAFSRSYKNQNLYFFHNLSTTQKAIKTRIEETGTPLNILTNESKGKLSNSQIQLELNGHEFIWLAIS
jgi:maltose alpha-D-glucosyltransferase/alpha-amylase